MNESRRVCKMQNKLNFEIAPYDDFLEARVPEGFYTILGDWKVTAYLNDECIDVGQGDSIYTALDMANEHYENRSCTT